MAYTKVDIGNMALSHLGEARINSFSEQSEEAQECSLWYDVCRQEMIEASEWTFARTRVTLELHNEAATDGLFCYRYKWPVGQVYLRRLQHPFSRQSKKVPFMVELAPIAGDMSIQTDLEDAIGVFSVDQTNAALFTPKFVTALSHLMAARMAVALTGKESHQRNQYQLYQIFLSSARASDANQNANLPPKDADVISARMGDTDFSPSSQVDIWDVAGNTGS